MKVYSQNIGKILVKINFTEHILPIFLIYFINILVKTMKYKESFNYDFSNTVCLIWLKFEKGIFSDFNKIFLWHESEDINKKSLFPKFQLIPILHFQVMHDYVCLISPIDYCVE